MKCLTIGNGPTLGLLIIPSGEQPVIHPGNPVTQRLAADQVADWIFENMPAAFVEKLERACIQRRAEREQDFAIMLGKDPHTRYLLEKS
jgi:hypothetical protein